MRRILGFAALAALAAACGGETGTGGTTTSNTTSASGGSGGGSGGSTGGSGGNHSSSSSSGTPAGGGGSGGSATVCTPNATEPCYSGPFGTENVGDCKGGTHTCNADGLGYGPCVGEVTPQLETCLTPGDEDCNGKANEGGDGCVCVPGSVQLCYSGPANTAGVGACTEGVLTCLDDGTGFGPCVGEVTPQPEDCSTPIDEDCDGQTPLCPALWSKRFGDVAGQFAWGLAVDASGNTLITGDLSGTADLGGGALTSAGLSDVFLAKYDAAGAHVWSKRFGNAALQSGQSVAVAANGDVVITGYFQGTIQFGPSVLTTAGAADIFLARFDAAGNHLWSKRFGSATDDQLGLAVAVDGSGGVLLTGSFAGAMTFGGATLTSAGGADIFVAKYDTAGNHLWSKRFGDAALNQQGRAIAADVVGNVWVTGSFDGTVSFGGNNLVTAGGSDAFIAKLDGNGTHLYSASFGDAGFQEGRGVATDAANDVVLVGNFGGGIDLGGGPLPNAGNFDMFAAKFDLNGAHLASKSFGGAGYDEATAVTIAGGSIGLTGHTEGDAAFGATMLTGLGGRDILAAKLAVSDLSVTWARSFGDASFYQSGQGVGLDGMGNMLLAGYFFGSADFGLGALTSAGDADVFIAKLGP